MRGLTPEKVAAQFAKCGHTPPTMASRARAAVDVLANSKWAGPLMGMSVTVAMRTQTEANAGGSFWGKARGAKRQRQTVRALLAGPLLPALPVVVTMTRLGRRRLDDDNLASAMKHVRDGIADAYGVDDADGRYTWAVAQETTRGAYAVRVEIRGRRE